ncbi:carotenoid 1,2-hydratase [Paracidovorax avenae]|uniref:carotenoid 1,2-hydratase n=1 Tax=Paracidovorax avenae TaxID=80867 RepID=UPI001F345021|nr:carotenoid 1,2-hydratase [Paracidovorax avenae]
MKITRMNGLAHALAIATFTFLATAVSAQAIGTFPPIEKSITLPRDEAAHRQPAEWWYMTGFLDGTDPSGGKRSYAYEMVVFQIIGVANTSPVYDAHFAISDLDRGDFRFKKQVLPGPFMTSTDRFDLDVAGFQMGGSMGSYYAKAAPADMNYAIDLSLRAQQGPTLNGTNGVETYGGFISPYYSFNVNATSGTVWDHGVPVEVTGTSWYDHEWANGIPGDAHSGWLWLGVSLDDNSQYNMSFFMNGDGTVDQAIAVKTADGHYAPLDPSAIQLERIGNWTSPNTDYTYPAQVKVTLPDGAITVTPMLQNAELYAPATQKFYFEGPAKVVGTVAGKSITGKAFLEMNPWGVEWGARVLP